MQRGPRTGVEEINSYFDERAVRVPPIGANVITLVTADVRLNVVGPAAAVDRCSTRVAQGREPLKVGDAIRLRVEAVEQGARAWQELVDQEWRKVRRTEHVPARDRYRHDRLSAAIREGQRRQYQARAKRETSSSGRSAQEMPSMQTVLACQVWGSGWGHDALSIARSSGHRLRAIAA